MESQGKHPIYPWVRENWPLGELYDLKEDPQEFTNLYYQPEYTGIIKELSARMWLWMQSIDDPLALGPAPDPWYEDAMDDLKSHITQ